MVHVHYALLYLSIAYRPVSIQSNQCAKRMLKTKKAHMFSIYAATGTPTTS